MPSPRCPGCHRTTERATGLCAFCRVAVWELRPLRHGWNPNAALTRLRQLNHKWVESGLSPGEVDDLVQLTTELDRQLRGDGYLPDEWDPEEGWEETPVPKRVETVHTDLL